MRDQYSRAPTFIGLGKTPVATSRKNATSDMSQYGIDVFRSIIAGQYGSLLRCALTEVSADVVTVFHSEPTPPTLLGTRTVRKPAPRIQNHEAAHCLTIIT